MDVGRDALNAKPPSFSFESILSTITSGIPSLEHKSTSETSVVDEVPDLLQRRGSTSWDRRWFHPSFPLIKAGPIDTFDMDDSRRYKVIGRHISLFERFLSPVFTMSSKGLLSLGWILYVAIGVLFGVIFWVGGDNCSNFEDELDYMRALSLSAHIMSTVGFGSVYTTSAFCNAVMYFQSYVTVGIVAILTGALFLNFSRPDLGLIFSERAVLHTFNKKDGENPVFEFQIIKTSPSCLLNATVTVVLWDCTNFPQTIHTLLEITPPDSGLALEPGMRISHTVNRKSGFRKIVEYAMANDVLSNCFHIVVTISGMHARTGVIINSVYAYTHENISLRKKFVPEFYGDLTNTSSPILEIDLAHVHTLKDEAEVNAQIRKERARTRLTNFKTKVIKGKKFGVMLSEQRSLEAFKNASEKKKLNKKKLRGSLIGMFQSESEEKPKGRKRSSLKKYGKMQVGTSSRVDGKMQEHVIQEQDEGFPLETHELASSHDGSTVENEAIETQRSYACDNTQGIVIDQNEIEMAD